ncbi:hypothetical protein CEXT_400461 [Caerostris extrusa]|uniref:Uncharacterized protein n=1 Tax=Caerostris extrusa TaxID=172846 RepID=A0AAV4Q4K7_CAEEX|nr:hypothetical protein CEXT_400461 [Caerostris extrusa]
MAANVYFWDREDRAHYYSAIYSPDLSPSRAIFPNLRHPRVISPDLVFILERSIQIWDILERSLQMFLNLAVVFVPYMSDDPADRKST